MRHLEQETAPPDEPKSEFLSDFLEIKEEIPRHILEECDFIKNDFTSDDESGIGGNLNLDLNNDSDSDDETNKSKKRHRRKLLVPQRAVQVGRSGSTCNSSESSQDVSENSQSTFSNVQNISDEAQVDKFFNGLEIPDNEDLLNDINEDDIFKDLQEEADGEKLDDEILDNVKEEWRAHWGVKCNMCEQVFPYKTEFDKHYQENYGLIPVYTCTFCNKTAEKYSTFRSHCYRHITEGRYKCQECPKGFSLQSMLHVHILAKHTKAKPFMCDECGKSFVTKPGLKIHLRKHKTELKEDYPCVECGKILHTRGGLTSHMNVHRLGRRFMCDVCGKTFTQKVNMQQHVKQHTGDKPHGCDKCGKTFAEKSHLARHYSFHSDQRPFKCDVCQKMYKTERCLKVHSLVHAAARPFVCSYCSKGFLSSTKLKQHYNIHTGERPYKCKYCERTFTNYPNWLKHTRRRHKVDHKTGENLGPKLPKNETDPVSAIPAEQTDSTEQLVADITLSKNEELLLQQGLLNFPLTDDKFLIPQQIDLLAGSATSQDEQFRCEGHAEHSLSCMQNYLQSGKLCDVTLIAGNTGKKVQAHRLVLSAASEYFAAMFTGSLRESEEAEITLGDVSGEVLQAVVNYCYTGAIDIREDNVETLLATACLMQLHEVVEACSRFLAHQLHPSNCLGIAVFAEHQACTSLLQEANAYTSQNFMQVIRNQEFLQLSVEQMTNLLANDDLNVTSEEHIFHALMSWINHDLTTRKPLIGRLLAYVKLPLLSPVFLIDKVEPVVGTDPSCQKLIMEALKWHLLPDRHLQMANSRTRPRKATLGRLLVVGGMDKNKGATTIESYDPRCDLWTVAHHMSGRRLQFGIALLGDKLLVVGGRDGLKTLNTMECLDMETGSWTQLSPMNTHRHGLGVAVLGGTLYAVGGHDGWSYLNNVERWDPVTRSWSYVTPMQSQRCSAGVAVLKGKLYAVGGRDGASCLRTVECYDPHTNKWTPCAPLVRRRGGVGVAVANGFLYAMGGQDAPANNPAASRFDCVERYDPSIDTWTPIAPLSSKRDAVAACLFGDRLVAIGGYDGSHYLRTVEQYDPNTNEWSALAPLITGRAGACVITVSNAHVHSSD